MIVTPEVMDILLESLDLLKVLLENVREGNKEELDLTDITTRLTAITEGGAGSPEPVANDEAAEGPDGSID